ncbi:MAG: LptA/OstA family protein, partial [Desulfosarcinaceae bacterium]
MDSAIVDQPTKCTPIILFTVLLILILPLPSGAQSPSDIQANQTPQPWNISADHLSFNKNTDTYEARGNVSITREGRQLTADEVQFNRKSGEAVAQGNVRLVSGEGWLEATRLDLNLDTEVGRLKKGKLFLKESHFYIFGDEISKTGKDTYQVRQATFTTCDGPDPAWKITGSDLAIRIEGYGTAKNVAFWAKKMPLFYSPYLIFPAKTKRQSGLLMPEIGYSDRKGAEYLQPLYWAINDSSDATFYLQHMSERGERVGLE